MPLQRLSDQYRHRVSRVNPCARRYFQDCRPADDLPQDYRGERNAARHGVLRQMWLADLFDDARRRCAADLHAAGRHSTPTRSAHASAAAVVALGAALGHDARRHAEDREAKLMRARTQHTSGCRLVAQAWKPTKNKPCVYRKLDSAIVVMKAAKDGRRYAAAHMLDGTMDRSVFGERPMSPSPLTSRRFGHAINTDEVFRYTHRRRRAHPP